MQIIVLKNKKIYLCTKVGPNNKMNFFHSALKESSVLLLKAISFSTLNLSFRKGRKLSKLAVLLCCLEQKIKYLATRIMKFNMSL